MKRFLFVVLLAACDSGVEPAPDVVLQLNSGGDQIAGFGETLAQPVSVRLTSSGQPLSNQEVRWRVIEGGGSVDHIVTMSDAAGNATVVWRLGETGRQLLLATSGNASLTIQANGRFAITSVSAGYRHACALSSVGEAFCWGENSQSQLGDGTTQTRATPVRVASGIRFRKLSAGWSHTCGLSTGNAVYCWGDNSVGQLGPSVGVKGSGIPVLAASDNFIDVTAGFIHTCGVTTAGVSRCWGANTQQQYGPVPATNLKSISAGEFHTCGIRNDSTAVCLGWNSTGELGANLPLGTMTSVAQQTWQAQRFTSVSADIRHTCALGADTRVYCWGRNGAGETGQDPSVHIAVPAAVANTQNFTAVTTGNVHTCGLSAGRAYCWGTPLGNGTTSSSKTPVAISSSLQFSMISAGYDQTCGVANGEVWCWGVQQLTPVRVIIP